MSFERESSSVVLADLIRLIAALLVMAFHLGLQSWDNPSSGAGEFLHAPERYDWAVPFVWFGWVGVQIFFVLSGYIISFSLRGTALDFAKRRFLRVYPGAWLCVLVTLFFVLIFTQRPLGEVFAETVRSAVIWPKGDWLVGVYWTLPVELSFYALMCVLLKFKSNVPSAMLTLSVVSGIYWIATFFDLIDWLPSWMANLMLLTYGANFALGSFIFTWYNDSAKVILAFGIAVSGCVSVISILPKALSEAAEHDQYFWVPIAVWSASVVSLFLAVYFNQWAIRSIGSTWTRRAGLMTYPLYLLHIPVGATAMNFGGLAVGLVAALAAATVVALILEPRLRAFTAALIRLRRSDRQLRFASGQSGEDRNGCG